MRYTRLLIIVLLASQAATTAAVSGERTSLSEPISVSRPKDGGRRLTTATPLDRIATAIDGAESSHGEDAGMWRPDPSGPQGPMQIGEAAATDVGGGDRFDMTQNRAIGRAYLAQLYGRYRNWPDAIAAYNWGIGKMDAWVKAGRPPYKFLVGVASYLRRVLDDSGLCNGTEPNRLRQLARITRSSTGEAALAAPVPSMCAQLDSGRSSTYLEKANMTPRQPQSRLEREAAEARSSWLTAMRDSFGCATTSRESLRCR
jgi:transglycosylase-like protein with SLT domain